MRGTLGFSVLQIWPMFGSVFRFSHLKTAVFRFWGPPRFAGFLECSLWFSIFVNKDGVFSGLLSSACVAKKVTKTGAKTGVIPS